MISMRNITIRTAKSASYLGNVGWDLACKECRTQPMIDIFEDGDLRCRFCGGREYIDAHDDDQDSV